MNKVPFVHYDRQYLALKKDIDVAQQRVQSEGQLILREEVMKFELELAKLLGKKYAVALNSGTDALVLALKALGIGHGDEVITSAHTFKATVGAIKTVSATPILVDIGRDGLMDCDQLVYKIKAGKTKAIIPVHIAGAVCNMNQIMDMANNLRIPVIEDSCQALGNLEVGRGVIQCWSFYPAKILGAAGDAGALTTDDGAIYDYCMGARNHFKESNQDFGMNSRMDNIQAATLNVKLPYLPAYISRREEIADIYLQNLPSSIVPLSQQDRVWQDFIVRTSKRDELKKYLTEHGIETMVNEYPMSPAFPKPKMAAEYEKQTLRIPCNAEMTNEECWEVINGINDFYKDENR